MKSKNILLSLIIFILLGIGITNAVTCFPTWDGSWIVNKNCTYPNGYKIYGDIVVGTKTVNLGNNSKLGIDLNNNKIMFTNGKINLSTTAKIDNSISSRYYISKTYSNNNITNCPEGSKVMNTSHSAILTSVQHVGASGTMYCAKVGPSSVDLRATHIIGSSSYPGQNCKDILIHGGSHGDGNYWVQPTGASSKFQVYCNMTRDGGGWTKVDHNIDKNLRKYLKGTEVITVYNRKNISGKMGLYYEKFKTKQCGHEHTTIIDLISQLNGGTWGNCGRGSTAGDYNDIQVRDIRWDGFRDDPCTTDGHKTSARNTSWNNNGGLTHRIDSKTSLADLPSGSRPRCNGSSAGTYRQQNHETYFR